MTPITPLEEKEAVQVVPSTAEIHAAHLEKLDAWVAWAASDEGFEGDLWADYQCAIEHHANLSFQRDQANLSEAVICSI